MTKPRSLDGPSLAPSSGAPTRIIVLLHGYGSNGADLLSFAQHWRAAMPDVLFMAPNAPESCPGVPGGYQWWGLEDFSRAALAAGVTRATPALDAFLDETIEAQGIKEDRIALVGFSQGTMMALHVGLRRPRQLAGILGYSGMLADASGLAGAAVTKPPVLLVHGDADPVVPIAGFHEARQELRAIGVDVTEHVSRGLEHSVDMSGLAAGERFIRNIFA